MQKSGASFLERTRHQLNQAVLWFKPGIGIKRWLVLVLLGITLIGVGLAIFLLDIYRTDTSNTAILTFLSYASLR
ncbi:MAG: hypothetical protein M1282_18485, partial [Chloroflexi bacterium]|nr:hypothetical protein [Chloroflexota bacterium]